MPQDPISTAHLDALHVVIPAFEQARIWYRATGGLAGNLHGSAWPLHDIDLDYLRADWPLIEAALHPYLISPPQDYCDAEFRIVMAVARVGSIDIELCQLEDCHVASPTGWHLLAPRPERRDRRAWRGLPLWTLPLDDLLHYKVLIGRHADVADLRALVTPATRSDAEAGDAT